MAVDAGVPVVAAVEDRVALARDERLLWPGHGVDLNVGILAGDVTERGAGEGLGVI